MTDPGYKVVLDEKAKGRIELRGGNRELLSAREHECIIVGPAESAKSFTVCIKLHLTCLKYPGSQHAIVRKTYGSIAGSVGKTFERVSAGANVHPYGGETPSRYIYPNGSTIWIGGMDNPDKVLSAERDTIAVCQTEELSLDDWETLATRCTGRGATVKWPQLFGDCNPGGSRHWIRQRAKDGRLRLLVAKHIDNPSLYNELDAAQMLKAYPGGKPLGTVERDGKFYVLTEQGKRSMATLDNLTGIRRKRLRDGIWATAEGAVYDMFDPAIHVKVRHANEMVRWLMAVDVGYTNPAVVAEFGEDSDGRWHLFREFYKTGVLPNDHADVVASWWRERNFDLVVVDAAAAGFIAELQMRGINAIGGKGTILGKGGSGGIQAIQNRLKVRGDGLPRLTFDPGCVNAINEMESYSYKEGSDMPLKENDHFCDAARYLADQLAEPDGAFHSADGVRAGAATALSPDELPAPDYADLANDL